MKFLPLLLLAQFATVYPFFLWLAPGKVVGGGFFRFNLGLATTLLGLATLLALLQGPPAAERYGLLGLGAATLLTLGGSWNRTASSKALLTPLLATWGALLWHYVLGAQPFEADWRSWVALGAGGISLAGVMYAMVLGHWYLNVADLPIRYLERGTRLLFWALGGRLAWAALGLVTTSAVIRQREQPAYLLLGTLDGFLLWMGLLMGVVAPLAVAWLAFRTSRIQSTQSATGLLYVALILVVMGVLIFDGYLLEMGLPL